MDLLTLALSATRRAMVGRISTHAGEEAANRIRRTPASLLAASIAAVVAATLGTAFAAALPPLRDAPAGENVSSSRLAPETIILFNAFPLPTLNASPAMITAGPDGNLWFTEQGANRIGRITPAGAIRETPVPTPSSALFGITAGPDGNVWFVEEFSNKIGRITPAGVITEFPLPTPGSTPEFITSGPDHNLWFNEVSTNRVARITPAGVITEFAIPTANSLVQQVTAGPDGNVWFVEFGANKVARITPTGAITEFPIPTPNSQPVGIAAGPDGNVWFTERFGNKIGRIIPLTGVIVEFPIPTANVAPFAITAGGDGALWFTESVGDSLGQVFPVGAITEFPIPTDNPSPLGGANLLGGVAAGPDGNIWFVEIARNKIGRARFPSPAVANRAQQAAPIKLGTSGGNVNDVNGGGTCCQSGTLGSLVKDAAGKTYILSNNHVLARLNNASPGEAIIQTGYLDTAPVCSGNGTIEVAHLSQFVALDFGFDNTVDAAIAETIPGQVDPTGAILGIGTVSSVTASPALGMRVLKAGRTTGKTSGSIDAIHVSANVNAPSCGVPPAHLKFVEQFAVLPFPFDQGGDSGSLVVKQVTSGRPNPVGLLFGKSPDGPALASPIDTVLTALGVTFVGAAPTALDRTNAAPEAVDARIETAAQVNARYDDYLFSLPEVVGHGVGYSLSGSGKVVIRLFLRKATDDVRRAAPASLEGIPVDLQETGEFETTPVCTRPAPGPVASAEGGPPR